jgi:hypothetical protein
VESLKNERAPDYDKESSENEEEEANRVLKQIMDEQRLEEAGAGGESIKSQVPDLGYGAVLSTKGFCSPKTYCRSG